MSFGRSLLAGLEPLLAAVLGTGMIIGAAAFVNPKIITHPSHFISEVPNELIIFEVNEMPGCIERKKRVIMIAGEIKEQDIDPDTLIMLCGG